MKRIIEIGLGALGVASLVAACNSGRDGFGDNNPAPFEDPDAGGPPDAGGCGYRCSADLKKVLKACEGTGTFETVAECSPNEGCGVDKCVDACTSAAMSKGSQGCSFWTVPADDVRYGAGACFAALIANTWDRPVAITAEYGPDPLDVSKSLYTVSRMGAADPVYTLLDGPLSPGQVAVLFLAQKAILPNADDPPCPPGVKPALDIDPIRHGTAKNKAFHIKTDTPVAAYSVFPYGGATSYYPTATLLLPVSSWDKNYIAVSPGKYGDPSASSLDRRTLQIIADEDGTTVKMIPNIPIAEGEGVAPAAPGEVTTWTLEKGQVLQISQLNAPTGSPITSSKPVGMFGGSPCAFFPAGGAGYCDLTQQQIAPFAQWGTSYALVPYKSRLQTVSGNNSRETVVWSFVGAADGTELTYSPSKPPGAPDRLDSGQVIVFTTDALVTVKSQDSKHPFHAAVYMTGAASGGGKGTSTTLGDPDFVNVVPTDQYLDRYIFFTDFTYPETSLSVVRKKTPDGNFAPVKLECAGGSGEIGGWKPLDGADGEYEYAWVTLTSAFVPQKLSTGECGYGRNAAQSDGPFTITVWGWGKDASYGYAGGMGARPINDAPLPVVQ